MSNDAVPYSQEVADRICEQMSDGLSLRTICQQAGMPARVNIWRWRRTNDEFRDQFDAARREGAHALADDMQQIADDPNDDPNSRRIRVDTRKWIASKMLPKVYGDKVAVTDDDGGPIVVMWQKPD